MACRLTCEEHQAPDQRRQADVERAAECDAGDDEGDDEEDESDDHQRCHCLGPCCRGHTTQELLHGMDASHDTLGARVGTQRSLPSFTCLVYHRLTHMWIKLSLLLIISNKKGQNQDFYEGLESLSLSLSVNITVQS